MHGNAKSVSGEIFLPLNFIGAVPGILSGGAALLTALDGGGADCPRPVDAMTKLLQRISPDDRAAWIRYVQTLEARPTDWSGKIAANDAVGLAFEISGGDDCRTTSQNGKAIVAYAQNLLNKYNAPATLVEAPRGVTLGDVAGTIGAPIQTAVQAGVTSAGQVLQGAAAGAQSTASGQLAGGLFSNPATLIVVAAVLAGIIIVPALIRR